MTMILIPLIIAHKKRKSKLRKKLIRSEFRISLSYNTIFCVYIQKHIKDAHTCSPLVMSLRTAIGAVYDCLLPGCMIEAEDSSSSS